MNDMTIEQLEQLIQDLTFQRAALKLEAQAAQAALDAKRATADAARILEGMSDSQRAALAQAIQTQGIESGEVVKGIR